MSEVGLCVDRFTFCGYIFKSDRQQERPHETRRNNFPKICLLFDTDCSFLSVLNRFCSQSVNQDKARKQKDNRMVKKKISCFSSDVDQVTF